MLWSVQRMIQSWQVLKRICKIPASSMLNDLVRLLRTGFVLSRGPQPSYLPLLSCVPIPKDRRSIRFYSPYIFNLPFHGLVTKHHISSGIHFLHIGPCLAFWPTVLIGFRVPIRVFFNQSKCLFSKQVFTFVNISITMTYMLFGGIENAFHPEPEYGIDKFGAAIHGVNQVARFEGP